MTTRKARPNEALIYVWLFLCAALSVATTAGIIWVLVSQSWEFFRHVSLIEFFTGTVWAPSAGEPRFGVLPLICGALLIGVPVGLGTAIFMSEYAPPWLRQIAKPVLEVLAGIPTVVYGYFAFTYITPQIIQRVFPDASPLNAASAAIVVGIMIVPTIASLCDDALRAVPRSLREAGYALSATKSEVTARIVLPAAFSGVVAAVLLALGRCIGETMAVAMAAGNTPKLTLNPLESVQTMTGFIVTVNRGESAQQTEAYQSLFAVGLTLFAITMALNWISHRVMRRFREVYE
jgi:phosphate transport system permease protein